MKILLSLLWNFSFYIMIRLWVNEFFFWEEKMLWNLSFVKLNKYIPRRWFFKRWNEFLKFKNYLRMQWRWISFIVKRQNWLMQPNLTRFFFYWSICTRYINSHALPMIQHNSRCLFESFLLQCFHFI